MFAVVLDGFILKVSAMKQGWQFHTFSRIREIVLVVVRLGTGDVVYLFLPVACSLRW
jgi:hypothetical protein